MKPIPFFLSGAFATRSSVLSLLLGRVCNAFATARSSILLLLITLSGLTIGLTPALAGGGWIPPAGSGFFKLGQNAIIADRFYQPDGTVVNIRTISLFTTSVYGEYGFTDRLAGVIYAPLFVRSTLNNVEYTSGRPTEAGDYVNSIGDVDVGLKYGLIKNGPVVVSIGLTLGLPLGESAGGETTLLQTGDGEFNQLLTVEASRSMGDFYASALLGVNNRTNNFSEEFRYGLEVGYSFNSKLLAQLRLYGVESFKNGSGEGGGGNSIFANDTEFLSVTPEIAYGLTDRLGVTANVGLALRGEKILANPNYGVGVYLRW
ncbi:MAG: hypothetical protein WA960_04185 [Tunicatimonas sp.]